MSDKEKPVMVPGTKYALDNYRQFLTVVKGKTRATAQTYQSIVRRAIAGVKSFDSAAILQYERDASGTFVMKAWLYFIEFAKTVGIEIEAPADPNFDITAPPTRTHPIGGALCLVAKHLLKTGYILDRGVLLEQNDVVAIEGRIYARKSFPNYFDIDHYLINDLKIAGAFRAVSNWTGRKFFESKLSNADVPEDNRPFLPTAPASLQPMPAHWILEIARGLKDHKLVEKLEPMIDRAVSLEIDSGQLKLETRGQRVARVAKEEWDARPPHVQKLYAAGRINEGFEAQCKFDEEQRKLQGAPPVH